MNVVNNVLGSKEAAIPLEIGKTTVYIRSNIHKYVPPAELEQMHPGYGDNMWEWDEIQYTKDEYLMLMVEKSEKINSDVAYVAMMAGIEVVE